MARTLTEAGLACGHERVFTPYGPAKHKCQWSADSSWMAVPYLATHRDCLRILVYRHPMAVVASFLGIEFFETDSEYLRFLCRQIPLFRGDQLSSFQKACQHYVAWNLKALPEADIVTNIDNVNWEAITESHKALRPEHVRSAVDRVPSHYNHRARANVAGVELPEEVWFTFNELEARSGSHV